MNHKLLVALGRTHICSLPGALPPAHTQSWQGHCPISKSFLRNLPRKDSAPGTKAPCEKGLFYI